MTYRGQEKTYFQQVPTATTAAAKYICDNKQITSNLLRQSGISVPLGYILHREHSKKELLDIFQALKKPLVVKPSNGACGENVTLDIFTFEKYLRAVKLALSYSSEKRAGVMVEEMFMGDEYRILLTRKKVIGVLKRVPANVIGNGQDSIEQLICQKNKEDIRGVKGSNRSHLEILIDQNLTEVLHEQNLDLDFIPEKKQQIFLRRVSNISQGGDAIDFSDLIHQSVKDIALKTIQAIPGLTFAGIDLMSTDISQSQNKDSYVILEVNTSPGFDIHDQPYVGKNRHAAREFLRLLFDL